MYNVLKFPGRGRKGWEIEAWKIIYIKFAFGLYSDFLGMVSTALSAKLIIINYIIDAPGHITSA
jgi:hypothetical protein